MKIRKKTKRTAREEAGEEAEDKVEEEAEEKSEEINTDRLGISGDRSGYALEVGIIVVVVGKEIVGWRRRRRVSVALLVRRRVARDAGLRARKARELVTKLYSFRKRRPTVKDFTSAAASDFFVPT